MDVLEFYGPTFRTPEGYGDIDLYFKTRETMQSPWSDPINVGPPVNTQYSEALASITPDGLELYFSDSGRPRPGGQGGEDLWVARRATRNDAWQEPENLGPLVNSGSDDSRLHISIDGLLLFFDSNRSGGYGEWDLYMTRRKSLFEPWQEALNLGPAVNTPNSEFNPCISPDGREIFFIRNNDIWWAPVMRTESHPESNNPAYPVETQGPSDSERR
jgi:hypothetical protein